MPGKKRRAAIIKPRPSIDNEEDIEESSEEESLRINKEEPLVNWNLNQPQENLPDPENLIPERIAAPALMQPLGIQPQPLGNVVPGPGNQGGAEQNAEMQEI